MRAQCAFTCSVTLQLPEEFFSDLVLGVYITCLVAFFWLQQLIANGSVKMAAVFANLTCGDIGTKCLTSSQMRSWMAVQGIYNGPRNLWKVLMTLDGCLCEGSTSVIWCAL